MIAGKELTRGINATGGEDLIAKLNHGGAFGVRAGVHNLLLGLEAGFLTTSNAVSVRNEFGVAFPNHAERPLFYSGDALVYPFRNAINEGRVRPYVTSGVGGAYVSADLDNINDKEPHTRFMWNAGGGVKLIAGELVLDFRFTNHRLLSSGPEPAADLRSITVGVGYRFGK
jgi:opacity protein-like surface antigen